MSEQISSPWFYVRGYQGLSLCDWPGKVSAVVFLGGCNLHCPHCHNWPLAREFTSLPQLSKKNIFTELERKKDWLDGLVISGGEPTTVPGLSSLLMELKKTGLPLKLDSNGQCPEAIQTLLQQRLIHIFAIDIKGPFDKYPLLSGGRVSAGQAMANILRILTLAQENPDRFYFRTTLVPELNEQDLDIVRSYLPKGFDLKLQPYLVPPSQQETTTCQTDETHAADTAH